jgi:hypothetical protein
LTIDHLLFIVKIQTALSALIALLVLIRFSTRQKYIKLIGLSFFLGFITHMLVMLWQRKINETQSLYGIINYFIIASVYFLVLGKRYHKLFLTTGFIFLIFSIYNFLFFQKQELNSYTDALASFFILFFSIFYFYRLLVELPEAHLHRIPMFWFNSGFLIYRAGALMLFIFRPYLIDVLKDDLLWYWAFHNILSTTEHIVIIVGLYYDFKSMNYSVNNLG